MLINNEAASPGFKKDTARANVPDGRPPEHVGSAIEPNYGFAADAALEAASAAALAAAGAALAGEAGGGSVRRRRGGRRRSRISSRGRSLGLAAAGTQHECSDKSA